MRTEEIKIYSFGELTEEAQETAIENTRNSEGYLSYDWWDFEYEDFHNELKNIGVECDNFYWDLEYRGNFYLDKPNIFDIRKFIKKMDAERILILKNLMIEDEEDRYEIEDGLYSAGIYSDENRTEVCDSGIEELDDILTEGLREILKGFLSRLREQYNYLNSDEAIREDLVNNECEFLEGGERY